MAVNRLRSRRTSPKPRLIYRRTSRLGRVQRTFRQTSRPEKDRRIFRRMSPRNSRPTRGRGHATLPCNFRRWIARARAAVVSSAPTVTSRTHSAVISARAAEAPCRLAEGRAGGWGRAGGRGRGRRCSRRSRRTAPTRESVEYTARKDSKPARMGARSASVINSLA